MTDSSKKGCSEYQKCLEILRMMLDDEANDDQVTYLNAHLDKCIICLEEYNLEKEIKSLLKSKVNRHQVPEELVSSIRNRIIQSV